MSGLGGKYSTVKCGGDKRQPCSTNMVHTTGVEKPQLCFPPTENTSIVQNITNVENNFSATNFGNDLFVYQFK